jgi:PleD family two-component response regulator
MIDNATGENTEKMKILLVDDNDVQLSITEIQLKKQYEVTTAISGKEALDHLFHGFVPDLIMLDILMPDMDGWETFGRLRAISVLHEVPIIFLSSVNDKEEIDRAFDMGAADFIVKPFKSEEFLERISKAIKESKEKYSNENKEN